MRPRRTTQRGPLLRLASLALVPLLSAACSSGGGDDAEPDGNNQNEQQTGDRADWDELIWDEDSWS